MRASLILLLLFCYQLSSAQLKVLHYTETSGFDHQTRVNSLAMFQQFASANNFTLVNDNDGSTFDSLSNVLQFDLIIFSNTSGNAILDSTQRNHFEQYIQNGGALLGIHAASDTYRHSTANGNLTGTWDFYAQTIGGSVQENPNHVAGTPNYSISTLVSNALLNGIPNPWPKNEEYYYWENGFLDSNNIDLLKVEQTIGPNGLVNNYDSSRTVAWYKKLSTNSRVFYTSLGHNNSNYTSDTLFQRLILNATLWCLEIPTSLEEIDPKNAFKLYPNPAKNSLTLEGVNPLNPTEIRNLKGEVVKSKFTPTLNGVSLAIEHLPAGIYFISFEGSKGKKTQKFIVE